MHVPQATNLQRMLQRAERLERVAVPSQLKLLTGSAAFQLSQSLGNRLRRAERMARNQRSEV